MNAPLGGIGGRTSRYTIMSKHATDIGNIEGGSILINESESAIIYLGDSSVSPMSGIALTPGNTCTWQRTCPAFAIVDDATGSSGILVVSNFVSDIDRAIRDTGSLIDLLAEYTYINEYTSSLTVDVSAYPSIMVEAVAESGDSMTVDVSFIDPDSGAADEFQALGESVTRYYPVSGRTVVIARSGALNHPETIRVWGMQQYVGPDVRPTSDVYPNNIVPLGLKTVTSTGAEDYVVQYDPKPYASVLIEFLTNDAGVTNQVARFVTPDSDPVTIPLTSSGGISTGTVQLNTIGENLNVEWTASASGKVFQIRVWGIKVIKPGGGGGGTQDVNIVSPNPLPVTASPSTIFHVSIDEYGPYNPTPNTISISGTSVNYYPLDFSGQEQTISFQVNKSSDFDQKLAILLVDSSLTQVCLIDEISVEELNAQAYISGNRYISMQYKVLVPVDNSGMLLMLKLEDVPDTAYNFTFWAGKTIS